MISMMGSTTFGIGAGSKLNTSRSCSPSGISSLPLNIEASDYRSPVSPVLSDSSNSSQPPHMSPTSPSSISNYTKGTQKSCGVCGDAAKSMHFGGLSCDSCKAFFRRSVQNNAFKGFSCPYDKKCVITMTSRKACQFCRFEKCLSIGMEKGWVMTEKERRKMMQQRQERKQKQMKDTEKPTEQAPSYVLSEDDRSEIALIVSLYQKAYNEIPYEDFKQQENLKDLSSNNQSCSVLGPWLTFCSRMAYFFSLFNEFSELSNDDQFLLLQKALTSAGLIMGSVVYDSSNGKWSPSHASKMSPKGDSDFVPSVAMTNVQKMFPSDLVSSVDNFFRKFQQICVDEKMAMILILISLYSSELMGLEAKSTVQKLQERYINILEHYVKYVFKDQASIVFPRALVSLADVQVLAEKTYQMKINGSSLLKDMTKKEVATHEKFNSIEKKGSDPRIVGSVPADKIAMRARMGATGDTRDRIYQKIWGKVLDHRHITSMKLRAPSLLPFIIPIVKNIIKQDSFPKVRGSGSRRLYHRSNSHKISHRRRHLAIKRQQSTPFPQLKIKEEAFDEQYDDPLMDSNVQLFSTMEISSGASHAMMDHDTMHSYQQTYDAPQSTLQHTSPPYCNSPSVYTNISSPSNYPTDHNGGYVSNVISDTETPMPHTFGSVINSSLQCGESNGVDIAQHETIPLSTSPFDMQQLNYSASSPEIPYSPFSSGSSSSSYEDNTGTFSDIEIDVLTSLIECVTSQDSQNSMDVMDDRQFKEVIPLPLLTELQRKLSHG